MKQLFKLLASFSIVCSFYSCSNAEAKPQPAEQTKDSTVTAKVRTIVFHYGKSTGTVTDYKSVMQVNPLFVKGDIFKAENGAYYMVDSVARK